jgi:2-methylisocitrate lyase-like PEP mutase family enzyme
MVDFASPIAIAAGRYVLVIASEKQAVPLGIKTARAWIDAGASYICAWGPDSAAVEETFDYSTFLSEYGEPLPFTLMTTSHNEKTPKEALWFAFYDAVLPDDLDDELNAVVIVVDSDSLAAACKAWVTENQE